MAWLANFFSPSVLQGATAAAVGKDALGRVTKPMFLDRAEYAATQGRPETAPFWKGVAETGLDLTGADMTPEQWRSIFGGMLAGGPKQLFELATEASTRSEVNEALGRPEPSLLASIPFTRTFSAGVNAQAVRAAEFSDFTRKGADLLKQRTLAGDRGVDDAEFLDSLSDREQEILSRYDEYLETEKRRAAINRNLTRSGVSKDVREAPERVAIIQERQAEQRSILRELKD
jgi:hypothetical protein